MLKGGGPKLRVLSEVSMPDADEYLAYLEGITHEYPGDDPADVVFRFAALGYATAHVAAARRFQGESFLDEFERRRLCERLVDRHRRLTERVGALDGAAPSYEALQLAASVLDLVRASLLADEPVWIERFPEFQRTLARAAYALEAHVGPSAVEALHREAATHVET
jgi:hypothetical protein